MNVVVLVFSLILFFLFLNVSLRPCCSCRAVRAREMFHQLPSFAFFPTPNKNRLYLSSLCLYFLHTFCTSESNGRCLLLTKRIDYIFILLYVSTCISFPFSARSSPRGVVFSISILPCMSSLPSILVHFVLYA